MSVPHQSVSTAGDHTSSPIALYHVMKRRLRPTSPPTVPNIPTQDVVADEVAVAVVERAEVAVDVVHVTTLAPGPPKQSKASP